MGGGERERDGQRGRAARVDVDEESASGAVWATDRRRVAPDQGKLTCVLIFKNLKKNISVESVLYVL